MKRKMKEEAVDEKVITLKFPVKMTTDDGGVVDISTIRLGRLKAKHMRLLPKDFMERGEGGALHPEEMIPFIASLSGLPIATIDEIDIEDMVAVSEALESFFALQSQRTGRK